MYLVFVDKTVKVLYLRSVNTGLMFSILPIAHYGRVAGGSTEWTLFQASNLVPDKISDGVNVFILHCFNVKVVEELQENLSSRFYSSNAKIFTCLKASIPSLALWRLSLRFLDTTLKSLTCSILMFSSSDVFYDSNSVLCLSLWKYFSPRISSSQWVSWTILLDQNPHSHSGDPEWCSWFPESSSYTSYPIGLARSPESLVSTC